MAVTTGTSEEETRTATNQADMVVGETIATEDGIGMGAETVAGMEVEILVETVVEEVAETTETAT